MPEKVFSLYQVVQPQSLPDVNQDTSWYFPLQSESCWTYYATCDPTCESGSDNEVQALSVLLIGGVSVI